MAAEQTVVIVSHTAPPQDTAGAARIAAFARRLPEFGWSPVIVTSRFAGAGPVGEASTVRVGEPFLAYQRIRGKPEHLMRPPSQARGAKKLVLQGLAVPDLHVGWVPAASLATVRSARLHGASVILSSSPSESSHLAASMAARVTGTPWVAEFRDGWTRYGLKGLEGRPLRRRIESRLESIVVSRTAACVGLTRPIASDLQRRFGSSHWIPNGFDDAPLPDDAMAAARALLDPSAFNLVYTGSFAKSSATRSPAVLAEAMSRLATPSHGTPPITLTVAGRLLGEERDALERAPNVRVVGTQPQHVAWALQRLADALIVVTAPGEPAVATGKLGEYVGAGPPVLALAEENEAAALVSELEAGTCVPPTDPAAVEVAIRGLARDRRPRHDGRARSARLAAFHWDALTERLAELLERTANSGPRQGRRAGTAA